MKKTISAETTLLLDAGSCFNLPAGSTRGSRLICAPWEEVYTNATQRALAHPMAPRIHTPHQPMHRLKVVQPQPPTPHHSGCVRKPRHAASSENGPLRCPGGPFGLGRILRRQHLEGFVTSSTLARRKEALGCSDRRRMCGGDVQRSKTDRGCGSVNHIVRR